MNYGNQGQQGAIGSALAYAGSGGGNGQTSMLAPVVLAQKQLDDATDTLHSTISVLMDRLAAILGPSQPGKDGINTPPPASVATRIAQSAGVVNGATSRLNDILARLEI